VRVCEREMYSATPNRSRKMGITVRVRWSCGWMLACAQQSTVARRERWELAFGSARLVGVVVVMEAETEPI
jgi:hypothetical protein